MRAPGEPIGWQVEIAGATGQIELGGDWIEATPLTFGPDATVVRLTVRPVPGGMIWGSLRLVSDDGVAELPIIAEWGEPPAPRLPDVRTIRLGPERGADAMAAGRERAAAIAALQAADGQSAGRRLTTAQRQELHERLDDPLTPAQGDALRRYRAREITFPQLSAWLHDQSQPLDQAVGARQARGRRPAEPDGEVGGAAPREPHSPSPLELARARAAQERAALWHAFAEIGAQSLSLLGGREALAILFSAWMRCEVAPGPGLPFAPADDATFAAARARFVELCVAGLRAARADDRALRNLPAQAEPVATAFERIWRQLAPEERRPFALRLWSEALLPRTSVRWGVLAGDAEELLNLGEYLLRRRVPDAERWRYGWLAEERAARAREAAALGLVQVAAAYRSAESAAAPENPTAIRRGGRVHVTLRVTSELDLALPVWLDVRFEPERGRYFGGTTGGPAPRLTMVPGLTVATRDIVIPARWPPSSGYRLHAAVSFGCAGDPARSLLLATWAHPTTTLLT